MPVFFLQNAGIFRKNDQARNSAGLLLSSIPDGWGVPGSDKNVTETENETMNGNRLNQAKTKGAMNPVSSMHPPHTMIHLLKYQVVLGLALMAGALTLPAAEPKPANPTQKNSSGTLTGRIVFVDKALRALAVEVKGKVLQISVVSHVKVARTGKPVTFEELIAGQEVTIAFRESPEGRLEVVALTIEGSPNQAEAAKQLQPAKHQGPPDPFPGNANPANLGGGVRSPHH